MQNKFGNMVSVEGLQKKEVEKFPLEKWLKLSNKMKVDNWGSKEEINFIAREENKMTFASNNGTIAFVDGDGHLYVAPATTDRYQALEEAGYKQGSLFVPLSNGEKPSDPALMEEWEKMVQEADEKNLQERIERHVGRFRKEAEEKEIKEVSGKWLMIDGVETSTIDNQKTIIDKNTDGYNMCGSRVEKVGTYCENNGTIAFVDGDGHLYVAPATTDRYQALEEAGYKQGSLFVPLSNGEKPSDPALMEEWEKMVQEADEKK